MKTRYETAKSSNWRNPNDIKQAYANASISKNN
ncbi:MAG: type II toxin-antitoxin system HigB family toxin [Bacteroidales bacterium]|nr:type II toxin-antitoxin system HigB family toxin [Bacteroidales bacterium]